MKIDVTALNKGDQIFWNKGKNYYTGTFERVSGNVLDLKVVEVKMPDESLDEIIDVFLITKEAYDIGFSNVKIKKEKAVREKSDKDKVIRTVKEKIKKVKDIKPNLNGLQSLLAKNDGKIAKGEKWYSFCLTQGEETFDFDYKGAVKDIFFAYEKEGLQGIKKLVGA